MTHCPSEETLLAFAGGFLDDSEKDGIRRHVADCDDCGEVIREAVRALAVDEESVESTPEPEPLLTSDRLGRYSILKVIGRGSMGVVYSAYDPELDRRVALKVLR